MRLQKPFIQKFVLFAPRVDEHIEGSVTTGRAIKNSKIKPPGSQTHLLDCLGQIFK
jgi:hypothetical protein